MKLKKLLLSLGLSLVFFTGLIRLPEVYDHLFPEDLFEIRAFQAMKQCHYIEIRLARLGVSLDNLTWLEKQKTHDTAINLLLYEPPSAFSRIWAKLFPENFWNTKLFLARKDYVNLMRKLKYLHALTESMNSLSNNTLIHDDKRLADQTKFADRTIIELIKDKMAIYNNKIEFIFQKLVLLENTAIPFN